MKPIGKDHEIIKILKKHKKQGITEGILVCEELGILEKVIGAKRQQAMLLQTLVVCEEMLLTDYAKGILNALMPLATDVFAISAKTYETIAEKKNSGGLIGIFDFPPISLEDFFAPDIQRVVVMDGLENPGNVGTILRTADAAGFDAVLAVDLKTHINGSKCVSASRGMMFQLPILSTDFETAQMWLQKSGFTVYLGEPEEGKRYDQVGYADRCALVVGSERFGINERWFAAPHERVYIPMLGSMTSLNVGVAASLLMYEVFRQKG